MLRMSTSSVVDLAAFIPQLREMVCKEAFGSPLAEAKAVTVDQSPMAALADSSEITRFPRDNFEVHEISKAEFKKLRV
jgi:hypothetical protein